MSIHALASLTATYTDSEPEGEEEDEVLRDDKSKSSDEDSSRAASVERAIPPPPLFPTEGTQRIATLVSYHDDAADDEEDDGTDNRVLEMVDSPAASDHTIELPPEPSGRLSPRLVEKVTRLHESMMTGLDMNHMIQNKKEFRNPSIYEKLIQFCGINELGTNYPPQIYNPLKWGKESFYEEIAKVQKADMEKREKDKKDKTKVEFVSGTKKNVSAEEEARKRKSKWDQVASQPQMRPLQSAFTTAASGTKSTVISAFGSLPKKPKV